MSAIPTRPRVLIVEDDEQLRPALVRALTPSYDAVAVPSAEAAVAEVRSDAFDAVLCDVKLAGMDGVELLRRVRESGYATVLIDPQGYRPGGGASFEAGAGNGD